MPQKKRTAAVTPRAWVVATVSVKKNIRKVTSAIFMLFLSFFATAHAGNVEPLILQPRMNGLPLSSHLTHATDPLGQWTPSLAWEQRHLYTPQGTGVPAYGYSSAAHWFVVTFKNPLAENISFLFEMSYSSIDDFRIYTPHSFQVQSCGDQIAFLSRDVSNRRCLFKLNVPAYAEQSYLLRARGTGSIQLPMRVWSKDAFSRQDHSEQIIFGFYYGSMIIMALYNLFLFFAVKDASYFFYTGFILSVAWFQSILNGYAFEYLWREHPLLNNLMLPFSLALVCLTALQFSIQFLQAAQRLPWFNTLMRLIQLVGLFNAVTNFILPYRFCMQMGAITTVSAALALAIGGTISWRNGYRPARFYVLAWAPVLGSAFFTVIKEFNFIPVNFLTLYSVQISSALNTLLLSLALADKIQFLRQDNEEAQRKVIQQQIFLQLSLERLLDCTKQLSEARDKYLAVQVACKHLLTYTRTSQQTNAHVFFIRENDPSQTEIVTLCENGFMLPLLQQQNKEAIKNLTSQDISFDFSTLKETVINNKSQLIVPFFCNHKLTGFLVFENFNSHFLLPEEKKFADTLSLSLGSVIENISHFNSMQQKARTEAEIAAAKGVQQSLLPERSHLVTPHFDIATILKPAEETGGDWLNYSIDKSERMISLFVGDVTGHGIASALLTGVAAGALSSGQFIADNLLSQKSLEAQLLASAQCINHALFKNAKRSKRYMTMAMLILDSFTGEIAYINAGHVHPIVIKKNGKAIPFMGSGPRLGFLESPQFTVKRYKLDPGDYVLIYTDGFAENGTFKRETFSTRALPLFWKNILDAQQALRLLMEAAENHWKKEPSMDDVTLMVLQWKGGMSHIKRVQGIGIS